MARAKPCLAIARLGRVVAGEGRGTHTIALLSVMILTACATAPRGPAPPTHFAGPVAPVGFPANVRSLGVDRSFYVAHAKETRLTGMHS
jgi:hypothetical protein